MMTPVSQTLFFASASLSILLLDFFRTCDANCIPSSCGTITNISYPFRLKGDPKKCGDSRFELACENDVASLSLDSQRYYVKEINYPNSTIRLADASINNNTCSFPNTSLYYSIKPKPKSTYFTDIQTLSSAYTFNFSYPYAYHYRIPSNSTYPYDYLPLPLNLMSCPYPLKNSSLFTHNITHCASSFSNSSHPANPKYSYIKVGHMNASEVPERCGIDVIVMTSWKFKDLKNVSLSEIHHSLLYGFELTFVDLYSRLPTVYILLRMLSILPILVILLVIIGLTCALVCPPLLTVIGFAAVSLLIYQALDMFSLENAPDYIRLLIVISIFATRFICFPIALWLLIYKFRRRHLSVYNRIESFLRRDDKLAPIRYSYSDIKKMTSGFKDKLGEGGYGSVYKGKLRSGRDVGVKMLKKSGGKDQDFINEISTIGRIHHINIITLVGYCVQGSKRALVFDFMLNGSLDKYLFNREKVVSLNLDTKFKIAVGVARGIEYLHRGCDVQILHFDIKPHNVLLDDKFVPKISDFGLAKFYSSDKNAVTMTAARGTIGYIAPELITRSIGAVSYKADVYSFGMLLMEMVSLKKDLSGHKSNSSMYFPYWIYDYFSQGKDIEFENNDGEYDDSTMRLLARKMTVVALWCIQMCPDDRPSMNKVLEMLESDIDCLQVPNYPSQSTQNVVNVDQSGTTSSANSLPLPGFDDVLPSFGITVQE